MRKTGIFKAMKLCMEYEKMPADRQSEVREKRLAELIRHARNNSPFYKKLYADVPDSAILKDLPPVNKKTLMANWNDWVCDRELTLEQVEQFMEDKDNIGRKLKKNTWSLPLPAQRESLL